MLSRSQQEWLLCAARAAVRANLCHDVPFSPETADPDLLDTRPVFVSVHSGGALRGCIGVLETAAPLIEAVVSCAISATADDPRFPPVTGEELPQLTFEISILSAPWTITGSEDVQVGRDGVIVTNGSRKALLLPQVGAREGWAARELLAAVCLKAGLPDTAWRLPGVKLEAFTAEVFSEAVSDPLEPPAGRPDPSLDA